jgi:hypothetical protein
VETAAPTPPKWGIKAKLRRIFTIAPALVEMNVKTVNPSFIKNIPAATPRNRKILAQM